MRFQAMVAAGAKPKPKTIHVPDVFVWRDSLVSGDHHRLENVVRTYYYTSVVGDEPQVVDIRRQLAQMEFSSRADDGATTGNVVPVVFKKPAKSQKTRNVDIRVVLEIMRFAFTDEVDRVYLASGDGDYLPLIDEVMRRGKQVEVLAFSSGLHGSLQYSVDRFHNLDLAFFSQ